MPFFSRHAKHHSIVRLLAPATAIRRTIIRHLILLLDLSSSMMDRDMRPTRFDLTLEYAREFIVEWFDQNPLGQIGIVGMRAGVGERFGEMSGRFDFVLWSRIEPTLFHRQSSRCATSYR